MGLALTILAYFIGLPIGLLLWKIFLLNGMNVNINQIEKKIKEVQV